MSGSNGMARKKLNKTVDWTKVDWSKSLEKLAKTTGYRITTLLIVKDLMRLPLESFRHYFHKGKTWNLIDGIDWTHYDAQLVRETGIHTAYLFPILRIRLGKQIVKEKKIDGRGRPGWNNRKVDWDIVDWTARDTDIAEMLLKQGIRISKQRISQVRIQKKLMRPEHYHMSSPTVRLLEFLRQNKEFLDGVPSKLLRLYLKQNGFQHAFISRGRSQYLQKYLRRVGIKSTNQIWRDKLINWDLPNVEIERIWRLPYNYAGNTRSRYICRDAVWDARVAENANDPEYKQAKLKEIIAAKKYRHAKKKGDYEAIIKMFKERQNALVAQPDRATRPCTGFVS